MTWASDGARDTFNLEGLRTAATKDVIRRWQTDTSRENVGYGGRRSRLNHTTPAAASAAGRSHSQGRQLGTTRSPHDWAHAGPHVHADVEMVPYYRPNQADSGLELLRHISEIHFLTDLGARRQKQYRLFRTLRAEENARGQWRIAERREKAYAHGLAAPRRATGSLMATGPWQSARCGALSASPALHGAFSHTDTRASKSMSSSQVYGCFL